MVGVDSAAVVVAVASIVVDHFAFVDLVVVVEQFVVVDQQEMVVKFVAVDWREAPQCCQPVAIAF